MPAEDIGGDASNRHLPRQLAHSELEKTSETSSSVGCRHYARVCCSQAPRICLSRCGGRQPMSTSHKIADVTLIAWPASLFGVSEEAVEAVLGSVDSWMRHSGAVGPTRGRLMRRSLCFGRGPRGPSPGSSRKPYRGVGSGDRQPGVARSCTPSFWCWSPYDEPRKTTWGGIEKGRRGRPVERVKRE